MPNIIEIEGDLVRVVNRATQYEMTLADFLPHLESPAPVTLPLLPKTSTRALDYDPTDTQHATMGILLEQPPRIINLDFLGTIHRLSIPFTRWFFLLSGVHGQHRWSMDDYRIFWAKQPFASHAVKDMIPALVPNIYAESGSICFGSTGANAHAMLADRLDQTVNEFYATRFNNDLGIRYPNNWTNYTEWEAMTEQTPLAWANWPDWDGRHNLFSYEDMRDTTFDRTQTLDVLDPIPAVPMGASFGRINEWLDSLPANHRARLRRAIEGDFQSNPRRYETT